MGESKCLTHLGHNLPKDGVDRYCIDLVCIAGSPLDAAESNLIQQFPSLLFPFAAAEEEEEVTMDKTKAAEATGEATMDKTTAAEATGEATMDKTTAAEKTGEATMDKTTTAEKTGPSGNFLTADRFRAETYVSSADQNSGKVSQTDAMWLLASWLPFLPCLYLALSRISGSAATISAPTISAPTRVVRRQSKTCNVTTEC